MRCLLYSSKGPVVSIRLGGCVGTRASLDDMEMQKFLTPSELELQPLSRPAHNQLFLPTIVPWLYDNNFCCNPILFAICSSTVSKLCKSLYNGM
jgi:hypothetical protein